MTTLADLRTRVKGALGITGTSSERGFTDAQLDQHLIEAIAEFSLYVPAQVSADLTLASGSRALSVGALARLIRVAGVEYPTGQWPRAFVDFDRWGGMLTLDVSPPAADSTARVYYEQAHLADASGSTVESEHEHVVVEGAAALAMMARTAGAAQTAESATSQPQTYQHLRIAQTSLARWRASLRLLSGRLRGQQLYMPGGAPVQRHVVTSTQ